MFVPQDVLHYKWFCIKNHIINIIYQSTSALLIIYLTKILKYFLDTQYTKIFH